MNNLIFDEIDLPGYYACYYFNADSEGLTPEEIADADAAMGDWEAMSVKMRHTEFGEEWDTFTGRHNGLITEMVTYQVCRQK